MKRKFSLLVTIVFCLLLVAGILSACNDPVEEVKSVAGSYFMKDDSSGWWELGLDGQWLNSMGERGTYGFTAGEGDELNGDISFYDAVGTVIYTGKVQGIELEIKGDAEVLWDLEKNPNTVNFQAVYAYAEDLGYTGSLEDLVKLFKGDSAYGLAKKYGYTGTEKDWLDSLRGEKGDSGKSAYDLVVELGYKGTLGDWLASLTGDKGDKGDKGDSAYDIACGFGFIGTIQDWLNSLGGNGIEKIEKTSSEGNVDTYTIYYTKGGTTTFTVTNGKSAYELAVENGYQGTLEEWLASLVGETGAQGADGKSAYELAVENGYEGTLDDWLESLVGATGATGATGEAGADGKSAYELAVENGFEGSLEEWLTSLVGSSGEDGTDGADGEDGAPGADGVGIDRIEKTGSDGNVDTYTIYFTDGETTTFTVTNAPVEEIVMVTVTFDADGGIISGYTYIELNATEVSGVYTVELESGESIEQLPKPTKTGYRFTGWYTGDSVNDSRWFNNLSIVSDMTLYAGWTEIREDIYCVVSYDSAGGSAVPAEEVIYGGKATEPEAPVKPGYDFEGWYLGSEKWSFVGYSVTEDMTLTAKWTLSEKNYSLTLIAGEGGSVSGEGSFLYNETVTVVAAPEQGYSFDGWYDGERLVSGDAAYTFPMPANDYELTAQFVGTAIVAVESVDLGEVEFGTVFGELPLPTTLTATDENGVETELSVIWNAEDYDSEKSGTQAISGTVTLPEEYYYLADSAAFKAYVAVKPEVVVPKIIVEVEAPESVDAAYNTPFSKLDLPETLTGTTEDGSAVEVNVYWTSADYDGTIFEAQEITGKLRTPYGYGLQKGLADEVTITVQVVENVIVSFETVALGKMPVGLEMESLGLPGTIGGHAADGEIYTFEVEWNAVDYNCALEGSYTIRGSVTVPAGFKLDEELAPETYATVTVSSTMIGVVDVVFVVDTTGSMGNEIRNVRDNVIDFAEQLYNIGINVRWALVEYRDCQLTASGEQTQVHMYFSENWYIDIEAFREEVGSLTASGGGDNPETIIDALETARRLDLREDAAKFFIGITDADYKTYNKFGISNMDEMIDLLVSDDIITSIVTSTNYFDDYEELTLRTGGILCDINKDFANELMKLIELIGDVVEERIVDRIEIVTPPSKTEYISGDYFSRSGMEVKVYYQNGTEKLITTYDTEPYRALKTTDTAITVSYRGKTALQPITVDSREVPVTGVEISSRTLNLTEGEVAVLTAEVLPSGASNSAVIWSSDNNNVATVSSGRVVAVGAGTVNITVTTLDGGYTASCVVTVEAEEEAITDVIPDSGALVLCLDESYLIGYILNPSDVVVTSVTWTSSDEDIATVEDGLVTGVGVGNAIITLKVNGFAAYITVGVVGHTPAEGVTVVAPTCTADGYTEYTCTECGRVYRSDYVEATGHTWDEGELTTAPGCTEDGVMTYTCLNCSETKTETIAATGHSFTNYVSDGNATCTSDGTETAICDNCDATDTRTDVGSATGHNFVDGVCSACGEKLYSEGLEYTLSSDESYYIVTGIGTASGDIIIPDTHEGLPVTYIGSSAFGYCSNLTSIEIPAGVASIGEDAFFNCSNLESVTFAEGSQLTTIGGDAFEYCSSLTSIEIPAGVTSIGGYAFLGCSNLESVAFGVGSQLTSIGDYAFSRCSSLTDVSFAEGSQLTSIGRYAFLDCSSLTSIEIPAGVTSIGDYTFYGCSNLESVTFAEGSGLTSIGGMVFYGCSSLQSIEIPAGVTSIGGSAFSSCSKLERVTFAEGSQLTGIGSDAFYGCSSLTSIEIPAGVTSIGREAFRYCSNLESVTFAEGSQLTSIGDHAFFSCSSLTSIEIPAGVTSIGSSAFSGCSNLETIYYNGTEEQWIAIGKGSDWDLGCGNYEVVFLGDAGTEGGEG